MTQQLITPAEISEYLATNPKKLWTINLNGTNIIVSEFLYDPIGEYLYRRGYRYQTRGDEICVDLCNINYPRHETDVDLITNNNPHTYDFRAIVHILRNRQCNKDTIKGICANVVNHCCSALSINAASIYLCANYEALSSNKKLYGSKGEILDLNNILNCQRDTKEIHNILKRALLEQLDLMMM